MKAIYFIYLVLAFSLSASAYCNPQNQVENAHSFDSNYVSDETFIPKILKDFDGTVFIVVRHAEKLNSGADPDLDSLGVLRASELKRILSNVEVDNVYSTPYERTMNTVSPTAIAKGKKVIEYSASMPYKNLLDNIAATNSHKIILLAGHSNTVPAILKALSNETFDVSISESQYDHIFIVMISERNIPVIKHLKYGRPTP